MQYCENLYYSASWVRFQNFHCSTLCRSVYNELNHFWLNVCLKVLTDFKVLCLKNDVKSPFWIESLCLNVLEWEIVMESLGTCSIARMDVSLSTKFCRNSFVCRFSLVWDPRRFTILTVNCMSQKLTSFNLSFKWHSVTVYVNPFSLKSGWFYKSSVLKVTENYWSRGK